MIKKISIIVFLLIAIVLLYNFRDHNEKRAIDACIAGSIKLEKPMTRQEAREFCEDKIKNN